MVYVYLTIAIIAEVIGTSALKASEEFTKLGPTLLVAVSYTIAIYLMTLVMRTLPVGITYAIWSSVGIVLITALAAIVYKQIPDTPALIGIGLIVAGVIVINIFSKTVAH